MRAFIVRPFGPRNGIDFDRVQKELIDPALDATRIAGDTTQQFVEAGNIRVDMFEQLLVADLVVADISVHNANVFYELGIRHALRGKYTVLIRAKVTKPRAERTNEDDVPFDLRTDRYLEYDHTNPAASLDALTQALTSTRAGERNDSPVFLSLPELREQDASRFVPVPRDFAESVEDAQSRSDAAELGLLAQEADRCTWEVEGWRKVGKALFDMGAWGPAKRTLERIRAIDSEDVQSNLLLGTVYQRLGDLTASDQSLGRVIENKDATRNDLAEAWSLRARNDKSRWCDTWAKAADRKQAAFDSPLLESSLNGYRKAFSFDLNAFYPGLNALSLLVILRDLVAAFPDQWLGKFDTEEEAVVAGRVWERENAALAGAVGLALSAADEKNEWVEMSKADFAFLTAQKASLAVSAYKKALKSPNVFKSSSARAQLKLFSDLGLKTDRVEQCLALFPPAKAAGAENNQHVVVFTGHRVDEEGRENPRFPKECVDRAREGVRERLAELKPTLGIAAAAGGGDILFHQVCAELKIPTVVRLVVQDKIFVARSVQSSGSKWVDDFWSLVNAKREEAKAQADRGDSGPRAFAELQETEDLPKWLVRKPDYSVWQRANLWMLEEALALEPKRLTVLALWNGQAGDGPGGTRDLLMLAKQQGATDSVIDTNDLCGLTEKK